MISLIHPSKSRPDRAYAAYEEWLSKAQNPNDIQYILCLDNSDAACLKAYFQRFAGTKAVILTKNNRSAIDAVNEGARHCAGDILVVMSDDFSCPQNWDSQIKNLTEGREDWILKTDDGIQDWIITLPIMDRSYYNRFGYIYYPGYLHMFSDTEMSHVADLLGCKLDGMSIKFKHNHYSTGASKKDRVSEVADATWAQGERLYLSRIKTNFGLNDTDIVGKLKPHPGHRDWLKSKGAVAV